MKVRNLLGLVAAVTMCGMVNAGEVDTGSVTTFSAGEPAVAADVNANFDALIAAINDNAARIAALENPDNSVAGHTYTLFFAGSLLSAEVDTDGDAGTDDQRSFGSVEEYAGQGSMTFDEASNTGSGTAQDNAGAQLTIGNGGGIWYDNGGEATADSLTITWTQTGNRVTVDIDEGDSGTSTLDLVVSEDGSLLVGQGTNTFVDTFDNGDQADTSEISSIVMVRD